MNRQRGAVSIVARALVMLALLAIALPGSTLAQTDNENENGYAGWYGPYDDGCRYWWDGYQWTGDRDCDEDGFADPAYAAGWYGPYDDGCYHWWDGYQWASAVDCDGDGSTDSPTFAAGWYGPYDDGCRYWWDGSQWTGQIDCDGDGRADEKLETYAPDWYDLYGDGCRYWYDGVNYTGDVDCNGDGRADTRQLPDRIDTSNTDQYIEAQVAAVNRLWASRFSAQGLRYSHAFYVIAAAPIPVGCTTSDGDQMLETEDWIFYCSADETIYFGPFNLEKVVQSGVGAVQFMVGHELGHHVQSELDPEFDTKYPNDTVAYEDQATCMAGVWFHELEAQGHPSDISAAMTYLSTATDEVHGTAEDQIAALLRGYNDPNAC